MEADIPSAITLFKEAATRGSAALHYLACIHYKGTFFLVCFCIILFFHFIFMFMLFYIIFYFFIFYFFFLFFLFFFFLLI